MLGQCKYKTPVLAVICRGSQQKVGNFKVVNKTQKDIVRYSVERYHDIGTGRAVAVGRHDNKLVMIPYEIDQGVITPITVHATTRQQIVFRIKTGRFTSE